MILNKIFYKKYKINLEKPGSPLILLIKRDAYHALALLCTIIKNQDGSIKTKEQIDQLIDFLKKEENRVIKKKFLNELKKSFYVEWSNSVNSTEKSALTKRNERIEYMIYSKTKNEKNYIDYINYKTEFQLNYIQNILKKLRKTVFVENDKKNFSVEGIKAIVDSITSNKSVLSVIELKSLQLNMHVRFYLALEIYLDKLYVYSDKVAVKDAYLMKEVMKKVKLKCKNKFSKNDNTTIINTLDDNITIFDNWFGYTFNLNHFKENMQKAIVICYKEKKMLDEKRKNFIINEISEIKDQMLSKAVFHNDLISNLKNKFYDRFYQIDNKYFFWNNQEYTFDFNIFFIFFVSASIFSIFITNISKIIGNSNINFDRSKLSVYECGFQPFEQLDKSQLFIFYRLSVFFIIFEAELIFMYPWLLNMATQTFYNNKIFYFYSPFFFIFIIIYGFYYEVKKKALNL